MQNIKKYRFGVLALFILLFGGLGVGLEFLGHAQSVYGPIVLIGGECLDNYNNLAQNENKIQLWQCLNDDSQQWTVNGSASTSGTIVNQNGYCLGILNGGTADYTHVILYQCDGLVTQQWYYDSVTGQIINKNSGTCLDDYHSGTTNGNQIDIYSCNGGDAQNWIWEPPTCPSGDTGTYPNCVAPTSGNPPPTPTPNPNPSPSPSPSPKPKPSPSPKLGGGSSGSSPSSGASTTPSTSQGLGSTSQPSTNTPTTLNTTVTNNPEPSISTNGKPSISNIEATRITTDSITLTWQATDASNYTIKYGLSAKSLPVTRTLQTNDAVPIVTLNGLPAGKDIYIQITPSNNGVNGATNQVNFKTSSGSGSGAGALILSILIGIAVAFIFIMFRRRKRGQEVVSDIDVSNVPLYPREDSATEASRLNWWMPDSQRQQAGQPASQHKADDDAPDMYEEGRKRLEDEEKQHKLPGS